MNRTALLAVPAAAAVVAAYVIGSPHGSAAAAAAAEPSVAGVVVDGLGKTTGVPDVLRVTLGVSVRRADVSTALRDANNRQRTLRAALRKDGVADPDVQTSQVDVQPSYDSKGQRDGYVVNEQLTAKLHDLAAAGRVISDAVTAGGSEATLQGVAFSLEDDAALLAKARDAAYADAKAKAQRYAELSGKRLGDVQLLEETVTPSQPDPRAVEASLSSSAKAASPVPLDAGTSQVRVSVRIRWSLA